jgi:hypothetical protein
VVFCVYFDGSLILIFDGDGMRREGLAKKGEGSLGVVLYMDVTVLLWEELYSRLVGIAA